MLCSFLLKYACFKLKKTNLPNYHMVLEIGYQTTIFNIKSMLAKRCSTIVKNASARAHVCDKVSPLRPVTLQVSFSLVYMCVYSSVLQLCVTTVLIQGGLF